MKEPISLIIWLIFVYIFVYSLYTYSTYITVFLLTVTNIVLTNIVSEGKYSCRMCDFSLQSQIASKHAMGWWWLDFHIVPLIMLWLWFVLMVIIHKLVFHPTHYFFKKCWKYIQQDCMNYPFCTWRKWRLARNCVAAWQWIASLWIVPTNCSVCAWILAGLSPCTQNLW